MYLRADRPRLESKCIWEITWVPLTRNGKMAGRTTCRTMWVMCNHLVSHASSSCFSTCMQSANGYSVKTLTIILGYHLVLIAVNGRLHLTQVVHMYCICKRHINGYYVIEHVVNCIGTSCGISLGISREVSLGISLGYQQRSKCQNAPYPV